MHIYNQFCLFNAEMHNGGVHTKYLYIWYVLLYYGHYTDAEMHNRGVHTKYLYIWYVLLYYGHYTENEVQYFFI